MPDLKLIDNTDPAELLPYEDEGRVYRAMRGKRTGGPKVILLLFVPNNGTHNRYLPMADFRMMARTNYLASDSQFCDKR